VRGLKQEREGAEGLANEMGSKSLKLQQWLDRNKPKAQAHFMLHKTFSADFVVAPKNCYFDSRPSCHSSSSSSTLLPVCVHA